jgi:hypothetical protein
LFATQTQDGVVSFQSIIVWSNQEKEGTAMEMLYSRLKRLKVLLALEPTGPIIPPRQPAQTGIKGLWARIRDALAKLWPKRPASRLP